MDIFSVIALVTVVCVCVLEAKRTYFSGAAEPDPGPMLARALLCAIALPAIFINSGDVADPLIVVTTILGMVLPQIVGMVSLWVYLTFKL